MFMKIIVGIISAVLLVGLALLNPIIAIIILALGLFVGKKR